MLEELRSLNDAKKKQVLIIATTIIMIIIIGVWIAYFNSIIMGTAQESAASATAAAAAGTPGTTTAPVAAPTPIAAPAPTQQANGPGLWQNIENGFGSVFLSIENIFRKPSHYNIQPSQ